MIDDKLQALEHEEIQRQVLDLEIMIADFKRTAGELDQQIKYEQETSGINDITHYAYPTFARAATQRRDNLQASISDLEKRLDQAREELSAALEHIKVSETAASLEAQRQMKANLLRKPPRLVPALEEC